MLALTSDGEGPEALARLLAETGFGASRLTVLEALGGAARAHPRHDRRRLRSRRHRPRSTSSAIEVEAAPGARIIACAPGLADDLFEHDGQITKREIRAVTLSSLAPRRGELLWDIGAGSGSVAIEWMLADPVAARRRHRGARRPRRAHPRAMPLPSACPGSTSSRAQRAGGACRTAAPDAIFIGGGASEPGVLDAAIAALSPAAGWSPTR